MQDSCLLPSRRLQPPGKRLKFLATVFWSEDSALSCFPKQNLIQNTLNENEASRAMPLDKWLGVLHFIAGSITLVVLTFGCVRLQLILPNDIEAPV